MSPAVTPPAEERLRPQLEAQIAAWAAEQRPHFEKFSDRRAYNLEICDRLAAGRIPPLAANVLRLGRWGQSGSVAEDVAHWYERLASRFAELEAAIPLAARRQASQLVESLWGLAQVETDQRRAEPVRQELGALQQELAQQQSTAKRLVGELAAAGGEVKRLQAELDLTTVALADQKGRVDELVRALADLKLQHAGELTTLRDHGARALSEAHEQHGQALKQLRRQLDDEVSRSGNERQALLHRVDQAQVESRQWMTKEQEAQAATQRALAALGDAKEAAARAGGELTLARIAEKRAVDALAKSEVANAAASGEGVKLFVAQLAHCGLRLVRDFSSGQKLARPDWMPACDWAQVVQAIGGAKLDGQAAKVQDLAAHSPAVRKRKPV